MSEFQPNPFFNTMLWLGRQAGFPRCRLSGQAERLLLLAAAAEADSAAGNNRPDFIIKTRDGALDAAQRAHAERRKRVHFKCDNSAKV